MTKKVIYGSPGCGKTTRLIKIVAEAVAAGTPIERIGFMSHTKKGAQEALTRTCTTLGINADDAPWFTTIHSACYRLNGVAKAQVVTWRDYRAFADWIGTTVRNPSGDSEESLRDADEDDGGCALRIGAVARNACRDLKEVWEEYQGVSWEVCEFINRGWAQWKENMHKVDFTDMLEQVTTSPALDLLILDEAQDMPQLQWRAAEVLGATAHQIIAAGDDDQAIFGFTGATHEDFVSFSGDCEVLEHSYRLPSAVFDAANDILLNIHDRVPKKWEAHSVGGSVTTVADVDDLPLDAGDWMLIARNNYLLKRYEEHLIERGLLFRSKEGISLDQDLVRAVKAQINLSSGGTETPTAIDNMLSFMAVGIQYKRGARKRVLDGSTPLNSSQLVTQYGVGCDAFLHHWFDVFTRADAAMVQYMRRCLANKEQVTGTPRIFVGTIHAVKGGEADNVAVLLDTSKRSTTAMDNGGCDADNEWRCLYVATTRAKKNLYYVEQQGRYGYAT